MMNDIAIKIENLSKVYKLYDHPIDRLKESLHPFGKKYHHDYYALKDVSFEIRKGETVGIVGRNGAGKSTLLKIITGVLTPSNGTVHVNGRIASLLELGAGFNPEMTGLENIFFSGTIMGFTHEEMETKLESILAFADIGEFIYQPVKTYSSGMYVRLAFAINVAVEPEILIVDEALAVGDALFQKRCYQHMEKLVANGTTLLFVSHEQESIRTLTNRAILLNHGKIDTIGTSAEVILEYRRQLHAEETLYFDDLTVEQNKTSNLITEAIDDKFSFGKQEATILSVYMTDKYKNKKNHFFIGEEIYISVHFKANVKLNKLNVAFRIRNKEGVKITSWGTLNEYMLNHDKENLWNKEFIENEEYQVVFSGICTLAQNFYEIQVTVTREESECYSKQKILHWKDEACFFNVTVIPCEYVVGGVCDIGLRSNKLK
ncbi:ABC transporter ATP-binding protein [Aliarcobacter butzleri]|uniref:ABC transporter ATP-binding protein n=1 Tax=Aliarcobacter butzleri TaxID=28197 RepID=UPI0021B3548C|nr:ABC transporter ATP-binding protein [Aliarcobacter butzleri]MCT7604558.1 ABC transporter ATP-binding protein [Aliarcobacter butzleri]